MRNEQQAEHKEDTTPRHTLDVRPRNGRQKPTALHLENGLCSYRAGIKVTKAKVAMYKREVAALYMYNQDSHIRFIYDLGSWDMDKIQTVNPSR